MTDKELILGVKQGDLECYESLMDLYMPYVVGVIRKVGGKRLRNEDTEEIAADVFIKIWEIRQSLNIKENKEKAYIGTMTRHMTINFLKKNEKYEVLPLEEDMIGEESRVPEKVVIKEEECILVSQAVGELPQPDREIFIRRYFYFEKVVDIAKELGINNQTVATKLHRGSVKKNLGFRRKKGNFNKPSKQGSKRRGLP